MGSCSGYKIHLQIHRAQHEGPFLKIISIFSTENYPKKKVSSKNRTWVSVCKFTELTKTCFKKMSCYVLDSVYISALVGH